jgi:hypothetical protein
VKEGAPERRAPLLAILLALSTASLAAQDSGAASTDHPAPRLAGIVDLASLSLRWDEPGGQSPGESGAVPEPLDITSTEEGPILLFSDRLLSLGTHLEMTRQTVEDLVALPRLPDGFVPSRLLLNPLREPILYEAESGALLFLHDDPAASERFETGLAHAPEAASLRRGGVVLSEGKRLSVFTRSGSSLLRKQISLPLGFSTGLSADGQGRLWLYDLTARKVRVFDRSGEELFSVSPDISGGTLLFPQVFQARTDGSFFLGSAGELWCFNADGSVRWRLTQFRVGYRQAMPAFYRLADGKGWSFESPPFFYILDPLGRRILKFIESPPEVGEAVGSIESMLASVFQGPGPLQSRQNEAVRFCLEEQLLLQAAFFRRSGDEKPVVTDLDERVLSKKAGLLAELARQLEDDLRLPEAQRAYNRSLSLYRELRKFDPVDPRYPEAISELSEQRNAVRQILVAENMLTARMEGGLSAAENGARENKPGLKIALVNTSGSTLEQAQVSARLSAYPDSRWEGALGTLPAGKEIIVTIPFSGDKTDPRSEASTSNGEDLRALCNLVVRFIHDGQNTAQWFRLPVMFPAGTLRLPDHD